MPININPHYSRSRKLGFFATSLIVLVAAVAGLNSAMGAKLKVDDLFRPDQLLELQIKLLPSDWDKLRKESDRRNGGIAR